MIFLLNILFVHEIDWSSKVVFDLHSLSELLASFGHKVFIIDFKTSQSNKGMHGLASPIFSEVTLSGRAHNDTLVTVVSPGCINAPLLDRASAFVTHYLAIEKVIKSNSFFFFFQKHRYCFINIT